MSRQLDQAWQPAWDDTFRGWAINFIKANSWRCEAINDFEDLLQDAYLTFRRVKASYPRVTESKHFMALYKIAMRNEMFDRARYKKTKFETEISVDAEAFQVLSERIGEHGNQGYLLALLSELPYEVKLLLAAFNDNKKLELLRKNSKRSQLAKLAGIPEERKNLNTKMCRILGLPAGTDLVGPLKSALGG
jgi:DNA-directed RNA polymerase specialized sigma24 family protein